MPNRRALALVLLQKAQEDMYAAHRLAVAPAASMWTIGFHVQQAVEKSLKAVLAFAGVVYPFTHDLLALVRLIGDAGLELPPGAEELSYLTPFGTLFRYDDQDWGAPADRELERIVDMGAGTVAWAKALVEP